MKTVLVTNSSFFSVAQFLEKNNLNHLFFGLRFFDGKYRTVKTSNHRFLICQQLQQQGYRGIRALYQTVVLNADLKTTRFMFTEIISKENYKSYSN